MGRMQGVARWSNRRHRNGGEQTLDTPSRPVNINTTTFNTIMDINIIHYLISMYTTSIISRGIFQHEFTFNCHILIVKRCTIPRNEYLQR